MNWLIPAAGLGGASLGALGAWLWQRALHLARTAELTQEAARLGTRLEERTQRLTDLESEAEQIPQLVAERAALRAELDAERRGAGERQALLKEGEVALRAAAESASSEALERNSRTFVELARATFSEFHRAAEGDLESRQVAIDELVSPLQEAMQRMDLTLQAVERDRIGSYASLTKQLESMTDVHHRLQAETDNLAKALSTPTGRGRWGEMQLRRVVELAGMLERCDFQEQVTTDTEDGLLRPDLVVHLPGGRRIVVDAKAPLPASLNVSASPDGNARSDDLQAHARQVRDHMKRLGAKRYWEQFRPTPEFVVMFLPGESVFAQALEHDPELLDHGVHHRVLPASPTTLIALLRAAAYGWQQDQLAANVEEIGTAGRELHDRLMTLTKHFAGVGRGLGRAVTEYNRTVDALETRVLSAAERLRRLGAGSDRAAQPVSPITTRPRSLDDGSIPTQGAK
jgi:DNA recombination protein RmuC